MDTYNDVGMDIFSGMCGDTCAYMRAGIHAHACARLHTCTERGWVGGWVGGRTDGIKTFG